ncbi:hypothetical protein AAF712_011658 [Marasmius tenuissimus]|uniref:Uncharacterized protein n=1 Tax=Marasmius tenuissimus TaxID=585030 RepID=A0ABR2ZIN4_9AGAR
MASNPRTENITYDDRDTTNLKYGPKWFHDGTWNASSVDQSGTLTSANDLDANVTFNFPEPAIAFYYFGIKRSQGGLYGICIDCDPNKPDFQTIDAFNATDDGKNPPVVLFSKRFDPPAQHVVILRNQKDSRGPKGNSQITIDRFVLEVVDNSPTPAIPSPSPSLTSDTVKLGPPIGAIVGGTIGGFLLAIVMIVAGVYYWYRHRRQLVSVHNNLNADDSEASFSTIVPYPVMHPSIPKEERIKAGQPNPTLQRPPSPTPSSGSTAIVAYFRFRRRGWQRNIGAELRPEWRREADAGPIPAEDEESTLPPLYEQVFQAGPSNRPPSNQEPNSQLQPVSFVVQNVAK